MKITNTSASSITIPGINGGAGGSIAALATYKVDPVNDDVKGLCMSEVVRGNLGHGSLTIQMGDLYTPAVGETANNWLDRVVNGLVTLMVEP